MNRLPRRLPGGSWDPDDRGLSMIVTALSLLITALLVLFVLKATGTGTGGSGSPSTGSSQAVVDAEGLQTQQNLATGLTTVQQTDAGGMGSFDPSSLQASNPSLSFTTGASTGSNVISVSSTGGGATVTLTARAGDDVCWVIWWSPTGGTWRGAQTGQPSCTAPTLSSTPSPGPVSNSTIGWQQGTFPPA